MCLVLSNLLENALEASIRTAPDRRQIKITAYLHAGRLLLIEVENAYDGEIREKDGVFNPPNERETASASSQSNILQKKAAVQVRLPIRMVLSVLKLCSADKCT